MKKLLFFFLAVCTVSSQAFTKETTFETWTSFNISYESLFAKGNDMKSLNTGALGLDLSSFQFINNKPIGYFFQLTMPILLTDNLESGSTVYRLPDYVFGAAFMHKINSNLALYIGLGAEFKFIAVESDKTKSSERNATYGLATDIGLTYNFTNALFFSIGSKASYAYANDRRATSAIDDSKDSKTFRRDFDGFVRNFSLFSFAPYIGIGYTTHGKSNVQLGRASRSS